MTENIDLVHRTLPESPLVYLYRDGLGWTRSAARAYGLFSAHAEHSGSDISQAQRQCFAQLIQALSHELSPDFLLPSAVGASSAASSLSNPIAGSSA